MIPAALLKKVRRIEIRTTRLVNDLFGGEYESVFKGQGIEFADVREYVPGDDLRHIHWRSSAKAMAAASDSDLLVRQYLDTRRSHATIVVDDRAASWTEEDDFETAMSVAASIAVRAVLDEFEVSFVCGPHASSGGDGHLALDAVCRSEFGKHGIVGAARRASQVAPDTSLLFLVGGADTDFTDLLRGSAAFAPEVRRAAIVVDPAGTSRVTETGGLPVLHLADSRDLAGLLRWSVR